MDCSPPGSSFHGISLARIMEWVAISFSRGSFWSRDQTHISWLQVDSLPLSHLWSPRSRAEYKNLCFFLSFFKKTYPAIHYMPELIYLIIGSLWLSTPHLFCSYPILCLWKPLIYSLYLQVQFFFFFKDSLYKWDYTVFLFVWFT